MTQTNIIANPGKQELVIKSSFNAPREQVYNAYTDPMLLPEWWGPRNLTTVVEKWKVEPGGSWRIVQRDPEGNEYAFHGFFHEIVPNEKITWTFEFEGTPGHVQLETVEFNEKDGKTEVYAKSVFQSVEDRDEMIGTGMEQGVTESNERLTELFEREKAA